MDHVVPTHQRLEQADPDHIVVTLFRCKIGLTRAWFNAPVSMRSDVTNDWHTSEEAQMIAAMAVGRARGLSLKLKTGLCIVDPDNLWPAIK